MDLPSQAPRCRTAFTGGSWCGEAWNPGLVSDYGRVELEIAGVNGGGLGVVHVEVETKKFVHLCPPHRSLGDRVGSHLGPVNAGPP